MRSWRSKHDENTVYGKKFNKYKQKMNKKLLRLFKTHIQCDPSLFRVGKSHLEKGASVFPGGTLSKLSSLCLKSWHGNPEKTGYLLVIVLCLWERG